MKISKKMEGNKLPRTKVWKIQAFLNIWIHLLSENTGDVYFEENYSENGFENDENATEEDDEKKEHGKSKYP